MVQLIPDAGHFQTVDHLRIGRAVWIGINCHQIVGFLDAGTSVDGDGIKDVFARRPDGIRRAGITRATTFHVVFSFCLQTHSIGDADDTIHLTHHRLFNQLAVKDHQSGISSLKFCNHPPRPCYAFG